jgi:putative transposase
MDSRERQACKLLEVDRSSVRYEARPDWNGELRKRLVVLAQKQPRYGDRRLWVLLRREGRGVNLKRVYRLYREARLGVRLAVRKQLKRSAPTDLPQRAANEEWALDFVSDAVAGGGRIRILTVLDGYTRQCAGIEVGASIGSRTVTRALERMITRWGAPKRLRCDNGPEFTSRHFLAWCERQGIEVVYIQPGGRCRTAIWRASTAG